MENSAVPSRLEWIRNSPSLRALNNITIGLLVLGLFVLVLAVVVSVTSGAAAAFTIGVIGLYTGGFMLGLGMSTGILALAVNAIVGAIARANVERDLGQLLR